MEQIIRNQIIQIAGKDAAKKADIVSARAAIIARHDNAIHMSSLIVGLWIGNEGEMPEEIQYGVLGLVQTLAMAKIEAYDGPSP